MEKSTDISQTSSASLMFCMKQDRRLPLPAHSANSSPCVCITGVIANCSITAHEVLALSCKQCLSELYLHIYTRWLL